MNKIAVTSNTKTSQNKNKHTEHPPHSSTKHNTKYSEGLTVEEEELPHDGGPVDEEEVAHH